MSETDVQIVCIVAPALDCTCYLTIKSRTYDVRTRSNSFFIKFIYSNWARRSTSKSCVAGFSIIIIIIIIKFWGLKNIGFATTCSLIISYSNVDGIFIRNRFSNYLLEILWRYFWCIPIWNGFIWVVVHVIGKTNNTTLHKPQ